MTSDPQDKHLERANALRKSIGLRHGPRSGPKCKACAFVRMVAEQFREVEREAVNEGIGIGLTKRDERLREIVRAGDAVLKLARHWQPPWVPQNDSRRAEADTVFAAWIAKTEGIER